MAHRSLQGGLPLRSTTNTQTFLQNFVLDVEHKSLKERPLNSAVQRGDLDRSLLRGLQIVQRQERQLSHVASALTTLLQSGAKWNSDTLLVDQKTPYHIICESPGDHHELLDLMINSSQRTKIDARDFYRRTALFSAVKNANINCLKCLIANGAHVNIGTETDPQLVAATIRSWTPITKAMWMLRSASKYSPVIMFDIFDLLLNVAVDRNKDHFKNCTDYILRGLDTGNVQCIKKLIKKGAPLNVIVYENLYVWALVARKGDVELLKCMLNRGIDKDSIDQNGVSILEHVVVSDNIEAIRYLLDLGVVIPTYAPEVRATQCEQCQENRLVITKNKQQDRDLCLRAICDNNLELVKLLDEYGSQSCKSFPALRCAVQCGSVDVVSYLLNKYSYPLNIEYIVKDFGKRIFTLLTEPFFSCRARIVKLLLDHGADPGRTMCAAGTANAMMTAIGFGDLKVIAQYIRSGVNINVRSWTYMYQSVALPFEVSSLQDLHHVSVMLLVSGCSRGVFSTHYFKANPKPELEKLMKEWNLYDNNVTPLKQRCRSVILNHLSPQADMKIEKLPLPGCVIKFLSIPELDNIVYEDTKAGTDWDIHVYDLI